MTEKYLDSGEFNPTLIACYVCGEYVEPEELLLQDVCQNCEN